MRGRIVTRRAGSWQLIFDLPRGRDGKRKQQYVTVRGTRKEAERELRRRLQEIDAGLVVAAAGGTVAEHLEKWLSGIKGKVGPKTHEGLGVVVHAHLIPYFRRTRLDSLKPSDVRDFVLFLQARGSRGSGTVGQPLAGITVHRIGCVLKQALEEAVDLGLLARNPARVKLPAPRPQPKRILTPAELSLVMRETRNSYLHALILLGVTTGARRGEILALRWQDVDLSTGEVTIHRSMVEVAGEVGAKAPKTKAGRRTVYLPEFARAALRRHKGRQSAWRLECGPIWQDHDLICCRADGLPVRPSTASVRMKQMMDRLGLPGVTLHGLRHGFASLAISQGANLKTLQTVMGHANIQVTLGTYGHLVGGEQEALAAGINDALGKIMEG